MKVALFGAAGAIGPAAASEFLARGHEVRAVARNRERLREALPPEVEPFAADLADPAAARAAAAGMDAIVYAVGVPYNHFELHPPLMRTTLDAARAAGVRELIVISSVYAYGRPQTPTVAETHPREPHTRKGRWRKEQEDLTLAAHDPKGLQTLVLRLPDFYGPGVPNSATAYALKNLAAGKPADILGPITTPHEWVYVPDVAPVLADLLERPAAFGTAYNLAGPGTLTELQFVQKLFAAAGRPLRYREAGPLLLRALGLFDPVLRELVEMSYLHQTPVLLDDAKLHAALGTIAKTPYDDGIKATVAASGLRAAAA
jgi:nucleoside-diphosphate-sugar epimerase